MFAFGVKRTTLRSFLFIGALLNFCFLLLLIKAIFKNFVLKIAILSVATKIEKPPCFLGIHVHDYVSYIHVYDYQYVYVYVVFL